MMMAMTNGARQPFGSLKNSDYTVGYSTKEPFLLPLSNCNAITKK